MNPQRLTAPSPSEIGGVGDIDTTTGNRALFVPFTIDSRFVVASIEVGIVTQNGNCDVGVYSALGVRLGSAGSTAVGAAGVQSFDIDDLTLPPGNYYAAFVLSGTTAKIRGAEYVLGSIARDAVAMGARQMAAALPLPAVATFADIAQPTVPIITLVRG